MRPVPKKYRKRDWRRSRRYSNLNENFGENWVDEYRFYAGFAGKKKVKVVGNRAVRRHKGMLPKGNSYKKIYDVMWEIW